MKSIQYDPNDITYFYPEDYSYDPDIFNSLDYRMNKIKWIIDNKLTHNEKILFLIFTENDSNYTKTSKIFSCSTPTLKKYIQNITDKIKFYLK